ncbi:MAG TPA: hypothetical protein VGX68_17785 [Thermoanaerobaculia bacterium]|jgi:hypothetical protein|nr:hypothetical protein [Thermoanaerobaculia bacterium]
MKARLILGGTLVLTLFALPAVADPAGPAPDLLAAIFAAPGGACALPMAAKPSGPGGVGAYSDCTAHCQDGSTRTCTGGSCSAVDYSCPNQRGYCWSDAEGYKYCPIPSCPQTCTASCANAGGGSVSCTSYTGDLFCVNNCYAYCDGNYYFCPNPKPICPV